MAGRIGKPSARRRPCCWRARIKPAPLDPWLAGAGRSQREDASERPETFSGLGETVEGLVDELDECNSVQIEVAAAAPALFEGVDLEPDLHQLKCLDVDVMEMHPDIVVM